jgi:Tfp pilus assembly protein FimV
MMPRLSGEGLSRCATLLSGVLLLTGTAAGPAAAQMSSNPPEISNPAEITACLCEQQGIAPLSADMSAKTQALASARQRVADLDAQLLQARQHIDVNNAQSEEQFKELLARRDQAYQASIGPVVGAADQATARYNDYVNRYNTECANHIFNPDVLAAVQAHLVCQPLQ